jgi:hypothetical protein
MNTPLMDNDDNGKLILGPLCVDEKAYSLLNMGSNTGGDRRRGGGAGSLTLPRAEWYMWRTLYHIWLVPKPISSVITMRPLTHVSTLKFCSACLHISTMNSLVSLAAMLQTKQLQDWSSISEKDNKFLFPSQLPDWLWNPSSLLKLFPMRQSSLDTKVTTHLHLVTWLGSKQPYLNYPMAWCVIKQRTNFTSVLLEFMKNRDYVAQSGSKWRYGHNQIPSNSVK